jgi:hypothetical protein
MVFGARHHEHEQHHHDDRDRDKLLERTTAPRKEQNEQTSAYAVDETPEANTANATGLPSR